MSPPVANLNIACTQILEYNKSTGTLQPATIVKPLTAYFIQCASDTVVSYTNPPPGDPGTPGGTVTFAYDGDGKRISKASGGTTTQYIWDLDNISEEVIGSLTKTYIHGPKIDEIAKRTDKIGATKTDYYYHADGLGSVSQITDFSGVKLVDYSYDVFGEIRKQTGSESGNTYLFCGRLWDSEIELYYNRARYYAPEYGRFITKDTHEYDGYDPMGIHRYLYCDDNPIIYVDYTGKYTVVVHGWTHHEPGYSGSLGKALTETGETYEEFLWSGKKSIYTPEEKAALAKKLKEAAEIAKKRGESLNVISHSWGTKLAYDAIKEQGVEIENLITMGSPLNLPLVEGSKKPKTVKKWSNLLSVKDILSYRSKNVEADVTSYFWGVGHGDYWENEAAIKQIIEILKLKKEKAKKK